MKRQVLLSVLAVIAIFAASSTAEAGMFGRLSLLRGGCSPCCEVTCDPCEPVCCEPCEPICDPCEPSCCDPCGKRPFRPFGGFFANLKYKFAKKGCNACDPCCDPCEPVCEPCEPICDPCEPICDPCETVCCDPCGKRPFRPFGGFFMNLKNKMAAKCNACNPCDPCCDPCEPACCDPCDSCH